MAKLLYLIPIVLILAGVLGLGGRLNNILSGSPFAPTSTQSVQIPTQFAKPTDIVIPTPPACEPIQYAITRIFANKAYDDLITCLASPVHYSRYESSEVKDLTPGKMIESIIDSNLTVKSWITNPDDPTIKKLKDQHGPSFFEAIIVLSNQNTGYAFTLDKDQRIMNVIYMTSVTGLINN